MSNAVALDTPLPTLDEDTWDDLLNFIEERRVIPIVGPELLKVETESGPRLFYEWMADKLAAKLGVDTSRLPEPHTLNDVVCWFLGTPGRREDTYTRVRSILRDVTFEPPKALRQLAQITDFDLFVTTTFVYFFGQPSGATPNSSGHLSSLSRNVSLSLSGSGQPSSSSKMSRSFSNTTVLRPSR